MITRRLSAALVLAVALVGCSSDDAAPLSAPSTATTAPSSVTTASPGEPTPSPSSAPSSAPSPDPTGPEGGVVLGGQELGVTGLGVPMDEAGAAVSTVLGEPDEDPARVVSCLASEREVRWGDLVLASTGGRLAGWSSTSRTVQTPSGVAVGTPLASLQQVYGDDLERFAANLDSGSTFAVQGVDVLGALSSADDDATVTRLFSSFCGGP